MRLILAVTLTALSGQPSSPSAKPILTKAGVSSWSRLLGTAFAEERAGLARLVSRPTADQRPPSAKCTMRIVTVPPVDSEMVMLFKAKVDEEMVRPSPCVP